MTLWIPAGRFLAVVESHRSELTEVERKLCSDLRTGRQEFVSLDRVDRILCRLDLNRLWHIRKEDGGLADIYEDGVQYGEPSHIAKTRLPRPATRKYKTEEERIAARRETWRRKYWRNKERRAA